MATLSQTAVVPAAASPRSNARDFLRRLRRRPLGLLGLGICVGFIIIAIFAPVIAPFSPNTPDIMGSLEGPGRSHWLGTDDLGRDVLSRIIFGSRVSLLVGLVSVSVALVIGATIGMISGYFGGWLDIALMRAMDSLLSFPALVLALAVAAVIGTGMKAPMIAIAVVYIPTFARVTRGQVLSVREYEFVLAARTIGSGRPRIMLHHVLPNVTAPLIIQTSLSVAFAILAEASLSFLGLGVKPPEPSWGRMVSEGRQYLQDAPWIVFGPGFTIFIMVMGLNFLGDALRDALDPRLRN
jgi:peptide/nickel transport system permease protein